MSPGRGGACLHCGAVEVGGGGGGGGAGVGHRAGAGLRHMDLRAGHAQNPAGHLGTHKHTA